MTRSGIRPHALLALLLGAAMLLPAFPATPAGAGSPPDITSSVALDPNPTTPGSTSTATFTFRADGPGSSRIGAGLLGTNGNGTFTDNGQVPELTNCAMGSTLRAYNCDWNPSGPDQVAITLQVNVSPETPDGEEFDVGSGIGNTFDVLEQLLVRAPTTTTSTTTTTTTPVGPTTTTAPAPATTGEARLSPTG